MVLLSHSALSSLPAGCAAATTITTSTRSSVTDARALLQELLLGAAQNELSTSNGLFGRRQQTAQPHMD